MSVLNLYINPACSPATPCIHDVTIELSNGNIATAQLPWTDIASLIATLSKEKLRQIDEILLFCHSEYHTYQKRDPNEILRKLFPSVTSLQTPPQASTPPFMLTDMSSEHGFLSQSPRAASPTGSLEDDDFAPTTPPPPPVLHKLRSIKQPYASLPTFQLAAIGNQSSLFPRQQPLAGSSSRSILLSSTTSQAFSHTSTPPSLHSGPTKPPLQAPVHIQPNQIQWIDIPSLHGNPSAYKCQLTLYDGRIFAKEVPPSDLRCLICQFENAKIRGVSEEAINEMRYNDEIPPRDIAGVLEDFIR